MQVRKSKAYRGCKNQKDVIDIMLKGLQDQQKKGVRCPTGALMAALKQCYGVEPKTSKMHIHEGVSQVRSLLRECAAWRVLTIECLRSGVVSIHSLYLIFVL